jgi:hypothetical protein
VEAARINTKRISGGLSRLEWPPEALPPPLPPIPPLQLTNVVGRRYGMHATTRTKGESQVVLADADPESRKPWRTTNQVGRARA